MASSGSCREGIDSPADLPKITAALMARGYSAEDCRKILGGNLLRVFREVEAVSKQLQAESRPRITEKQPFEKQSIRDQGDQWTAVTKFDSSALMPEHWHLYTDSSLNSLPGE